MGDLIKIERDVLHIPGVDHATRKQYQYALNAYKKFLHDKDMSMGIESLEIWLDSIDRLATRAAYYYALKKVLLEMYKNHPQLAELERRLKNIKSVRRDHAVKEAEYLTIGEIEVLLECTQKEISLVIEALFWTGCRVSELINIKLADCKRKSNIIAIQVIGKGRKERTVYMQLNLFKKVKKYFKGSVYLFEHKEVKYTRFRITKLISKAGEHWLDRDISAHSLRHSKAMYLKEIKGLTPDQIQKALGHSSVVTTLQHYFHGTPTPEDQGFFD